MAKGNFLTGGIFIDGETPVLKSDVMVPAEQALQQVMQQPIAEPKPQLLAQNSNQDVGVQLDFSQPIPFEQQQTTKQPQFPGPYAPNSPEIQSYQTDYAISPGQLITKKNFAEINPAYAKNPNYFKGVLQGEKLIPFINQDNYKLRDEIIKIALDNNVNPRVFLSQVLHETNNFSNYPFNNPGGVKPSSQVKNFINNQPIEKRKIVAETLTQLKQTREPIKNSVSQLQNYFYHPDTKFTFPKKQADIIPLTKKQVNELNNQLDYARTSNDKDAWQILANKIKTIRQLYPEKTVILKNASGNSISVIKNNNFQVTQPFMKYQESAHGFLDMLRARRGGHDQSVISWDQNNPGQIVRILDNQEIGRYK